MGEDESFDYVAKGVGREVVSGTEIPYEDEEVTGVTADDERTSNPNKLNSCSNKSQQCVCVNMLLVFSV